MGRLPLEVADFITVSHEVGRAFDSLRPDFYLELDKNPKKPDMSRRFFLTMVDDIAVDARLMHIPLVRAYSKAYLSRLLDANMAGLPLNIQLMCALKLYLLDVRDYLNLAVDIREVLGENDGPTPLAQQLAGFLLDPKTSYEDRHRLADEVLYPIFQGMVQKDLMRTDVYLLNDMYHQVSFFGEYESPPHKDFAEAEGQELQQRVEKIHDMMKTQDIDQMIRDRNEDVEDEGSSEDGAPRLALPGGGSPAENLELDTPTIPSYSSMVNNWMGIIRGVAEVFMRLAAPKESIAVPRYKHRRAFEGPRFDPNAVMEASFQLSDMRPRAIWQPVKQEVRHQELRFNGLDIYLVLDVSYSMRGENAESASAMGICLIEGLRLARHQVELDAKQGPVDVRIQLLAFGSGWTELTPLCKELSPVQKEAAYFHLMNPESYHTMVNGALKKVRSGAQEHRDRDVLCLVISDGLFSDNINAFKTVQSMPPNVYVGHINIGGLAGVPITLHYEAISDPWLLPKKLQGILEEYFETAHQRHRL